MTGPVDAVERDAAGPVDAVALSARSGGAPPETATAPAKAEVDDGSSDGCDITAPVNGFAPATAEVLRSYVYLLVDPRTGRPFFAGRGKGDRCFHHVAAASARPDGRDYPALDRIREITRGGREVRIDILRYGLTPEEARLSEVVAREALGLPADDSRRSEDPQRAPAGSLDARLAPPVKIKRGHRVVLLRLGRGYRPGLTGEALDELAHVPRRIAPRWTDPTSPRSPRWALAVADDVVRAAYRIDAWEPAEGADGRYSFVGPHDPGLERRYVGGSVAAYLGSASQNPVTFVWCGPHWVNTAR